MATRTITTLPCPMCGERSQVEVESEDWARYIGGDLIQNVWPEWTSFKRELIITGAHPECWRLMLDEEMD